MNENTWARRGEFVNAVLVWGIAMGLVRVTDVKFNGVADEQFDMVTDPNRLTSSDRIELIEIAHKFDIPMPHQGFSEPLKNTMANIVILAKKQEHTTIE